MQIDLLGVGQLLQTFGVVAGIKIGSMIVEKIWKKNREPFIVSANGIDEKIESKTGLEFPLECHQAYDYLVKQIVAAIDYAANPVIFRRIERFLLGLADPARRQALLEEFFDYVQGKAKEKLSEELKKIINSETKAEAVEQVSAQAAIALPAEFVKKQDFRADVETALKAVKSEKIPTTEEICDKIKATRLKLDALIAK